MSNTAASVGSRFSGMAGSDVRGPQVSELKVAEVDFRRDARWLQFIGSHPEALIYHHPGWSSALEHEYGRSCVALACMNAAGEFLGVLPLFKTRGIFTGMGRQLGLGPRLASLPRTPVAGPLYSGQCALLQLVHAAMERAKGDDGVQLQLKMRTDSLSGCVTGLHCTPWRNSYVYDFPELPADDATGASMPEQELRFGSSRNHRRIKCSVNKARELGVQARLADTADDLKAWYQTYLDTMRENLLPARPYRFFESLWKELQPLGLMRLWIAEHGRRVIAGLIVLMYGATAFYAFAGCSRDCFRLHPNDLLQFYAMHDAWRNGCRTYDFGESPEGDEDLAHYKRKWGAAPSRLYRYYYPAPAKQLSDYQTSGLLYRAAKATWRKVPLKATSFVGDCIYRYL